MTRKDSEKDTDRPHYYSQFWLDVAAGRTVIGAPKVEDETDLTEDETEMPEPELEPTPLRRSGRNYATPATDGYKSTRTQTVDEPASVPEDFEESEFDLADGVDDLELPDNVLDETEEELITPEADIMPDEEEMEDDELFFEDEMEEEEEDDWSARGRKKPKPGRQAKTPKPTKRPRRETRRGY